MQQQTESITNRLEFARVAQADHAAEASRLERAAEAAQDDFEQAPTSKAFADAQVAAQLARNARALQRQHEADVLTALLEEHATIVHEARVAELRREFGAEKILEPQARVKDAIAKCTTELEEGLNDLAAELLRRADRAPELIEAGIGHSQRLNAYVQELSDRLNGLRGADRFVTVVYNGAPNRPTIHLEITLPLNVNQRVG